MFASTAVRHTAVTALLVVPFILFGCGGGGSSDGAEVAATHADGTKLSADDRAAADFFLSKIKEHWLKGSDGWTTRLQQYNMLGQVMPDREPDTLFRQLRDFKFSIEPESISESLKLNGTDYRAGVNFEKTSARFYRTVETFEGPKGWSLWQDDFPSFGMAVERREGKWLITDSDLWQGILPDAADVPSGK